MNGTATILHYNHNADAIISAAGRISTTKGSADLIYQNSTENDRDANIRLIGKILSSGHFSILEHLYLNLSFDSVSVFVEQFMIEFRLASFTVKSRRYVDFSDMGFYKPTFENEEMCKLYDEHIRFLFAEYEAFLSANVPKEDARFLLPYCFQSNFYCTVNAREFIHIVKEMIIGRGRNYPEIRELGRSLLAQCKSELPYIADAITCPEPTNELDLKNYKREIAVSENKFASVLYSTPDPCRKVCEAYAFYHGITDLDLENKDCRNAIIQHVLKQSRRRELEQINVTFRFDQLSLAGITHLVRHRMQSVIVPEFVANCRFDRYVLPESIIHAGLEARYRAAFEKTEKLQKCLRDMGMSRYDGVYLFLSGLCLPIIATMNANELCVFLGLRCCNRAQWEIKTCADALLEELKNTAPELFCHYGPSCIFYSHCPEGKMTCGKMQEVKKRYHSN